MFKLKNHFYKFSSMFKNKIIEKNNFISAGERSFFNV